MIRAVLSLVLLGSAVAPARAQDGPLLFDLMKRPAYRTTWQALLVGQPISPWMRAIADGGNFVATPSATTVIAGKSYLLAHGCKAHDCAGNEVEVLFSPGGAPAFAMSLDQALPSPRYFGNPNTAQKAALQAGMSN